MNHVIDTSGSRRGQLRCTALGLRLITTRSNWVPDKRRALIEGDAISSYGYLRDVRDPTQSGAARTSTLSETVEDAHRWLGLQ